MSIGNRSSIESASGATTGALSTAVAIALVGVLSSAVAACAPHRLATNDTARSTTYSSRQMPDGKQWMTRNLSVGMDGSYCYDDAEQNCRRHGRLYRWDAAQRACSKAGDGWRLPTNDEWRRMAKAFGGVRDDSEDGGKATYVALLPGGSSGFDAEFGGGRGQGGEYARLEAHGFYWTATESDPSHAWFYNLGRGGQLLNRHADGEKESAFAVRCVRD